MELKEIKLKGGGGCEDKSFASRYEKLLLIWYFKDCEHFWYFPFFF